ncbi:MAG: thermonuclease family protein [Parvularcula sp.]|jgi:endonuclease YncB( thermonuclease family)|nr:thermonuclease family protein [Parvularcula sp.]
MTKLVRGALFLLLVAACSDRDVTWQDNERERLIAVDGDTVRVGSTQMRIENLDAPETGERAECDAERMLGAIATVEAKELVQSEDVSVRATGKTDRYGRTLVLITVDGTDWAEHMIGHRLAVAWNGHRHDWCARSH